MLRYIGKRLLALIPIVIGMSLIVFLYVRALPGSPADALLGERATRETTAALEQQLGLNEPIHVQYWNYATNIATGDLGISLRTRRPVWDELRERFPATVELALAAMIVAVGVGVPLGFVAAKRYGGFLDNSSLVASLIGISFPIFFLALLLKFVFAVKLGWLPSIGRLEVTRNIAHPTNLYLVDALVAWDWGAFWDAVRHLILPAIALATIPLAIIARITRAAVLDVLNEDYVRTAHAKGLPGRIVDSRHVLKNAMLPVVTVVGLQMGLLLTGAILTETVFNWQGLGLWILDAIRFRDFAVLQAGILFFAVVVAVTNLLVDISYAFLNPRIRYR
ncbi:MAG: ABC transporter permease [Actinobacteria bacterium]|nr:ABC transporter permease [Actinomycetota bacterium]